MTMEKKKMSNSPGKVNASRPTTTRNTTTNAAASSSRPATERPQSSESNKKQRKLCSACSENTGKEKGKGPSPKCTNAAHTNLRIYESLPNSSNIEKNKEDQLRKLGKSIKMKPISTDEAKEINLSNAEMRALARSLSGSKRGPKKSLVSPLRGFFNSGSRATARKANYGQGNSSVSAQQASFNKGKHTLATSSKDHVRNERPVFPWSHRNVRHSVGKSEIISSAVPPSAPQPRRGLLAPLPRRPPSQSPPPPRRGPLAPQRRPPSQSPPRRSRPSQPPSLPSPQVYLPFAKNVLWRGGVKYLDLESSTSIEFGYGFQVRLPCRLRKQAIEHAKKLPPVLQLSQLPPGNRWESLFQNGYPDFQDIALYILPVDNIKRLKDNYTSLLDLMEKKQSAMRTSVDGAELLLFTSNQLPVKSKDAISRLGIRFIYGVFLSWKKKPLQRCRDHHALVVRTPT